VIEFQNAAMIFQLSSFNVVYVVQLDPNSQNPANAKILKSNLLFSKFFKFNIKRTNFVVFFPIFFSVHYKFKIYNNKNGLHLKFWTVIFSSHVAHQSNEYSGSNGPRGYRAGSIVKEKRVKQYRTFAILHR
jgi:hypothetical protein